MKKIIFILLVCLTVSLAQAEPTDAQREKIRQERVHAYLTRVIAAADLNK